MQRRGGSTSGPIYLFDPMTKELKKHFINSNLAVEFLEVKSTNLSSIIKKRTIKKGYLVSRSPEFPENDTIKTF